MPDTLVAPAPATGRRLTLVIDVADGPDVLLRVLTLLRRRCCVVRSVDYRAADRHGPGRFTLGVDAPPAHAHRVGAWLEGLVDVLGVRPGDP